MSLPVRCGGRVRPHRWKVISLSHEVLTSSVVRPFPYLLFDVMIFVEI